MVSILSTRYSSPILIKPEFSRQVFEKYPNIKFHENPSSGCRVVPCGQTDGHDKLMVAFRNFANAPNKNTYSNTLILQRRKYGNEDPEGINEVNPFPFFLIFKSDQQFNTIQTAL